MSLNRGLMSSKTPEWATPRDRFLAWDQEFGPFTLDVCATPTNAKVGQFYTREDDGLSQEWRGVCWMNPPYGREIVAWVEKARRSAEAGAKVVCLLPARTDTRWWQDNICDEFRGPHPWVRVVRFIRGRIKFNDAGPAPFPSALVVMGPTKSGGGSP